MQKTWTDLLGPYQEGDKISGAFIVRPTGEGSPMPFKVLYSHHEDGASIKVIFETWKQELLQAK